MEVDCKAVEGEKRDCQGSFRDADLTNARQNLNTGTQFLGANCPTVSSIQHPRKSEDSQPTVSGRNLPGRTIEVVRTRNSAADSDNVAVKHAQNGHPQDAGNAGIPKELFQKLKGRPHHLPLPGSSGACRLDLAWLIG